METFYIKDARIGSFIWIIPETLCQERDEQGKDLIAQVVGKDARCLKVICLPNPCSEIEIQIINTYRYRNKKPSWCILSRKSLDFENRSIYPSLTLLKDITLPYYTKMEVGGHFGKLMFATKDDIDNYIEEGWHSYYEIYEAQEEENEKISRFIFEEKHPWIREKRLIREAKRLEKEREQQQAREWKKEKDRELQQAREREKERELQQAREWKKEKDRERQQSREWKKLTAREKIKDPESAFWIRSLTPTYVQLGLKVFDLRIGQSVLVCNYLDKESIPQKGYVRGFLPPEELLNEKIKQICIEDLHRRYPNFPGNIGIFSEHQRYLVEIERPIKDVQKSNFTWHAIPIHELTRIKGRVHQIDLENLRIISSSDFHKGRFKKLSLTRLESLISGSQDWDGDY